MHIHGIVKFFRTAAELARLDEDDVPLPDEERAWHIARHRRIVVIAFLCGVVPTAAALILVLAASTGTPGPNAVIDNAVSPEQGHVIAMIICPVAAAMAGLLFGVAAALAFAPRKFLLGPVGVRWMRLIGTKTPERGRIVCGVVVGCYLVVGALPLAAVAQQEWARIHPPAQVAAAPPPPPLVSPAAGLGWPPTSREAAQPRWWAAKATAYADTAAIPAFRVRDDSRAAIWLVRSGNLPSARLALALARDTLPQVNEVTSDDPTSSYVIAAEAAVNGVAAARKSADALGSPRDRSASIRQIALVQAVLGDYTGAEATVAATPAANADLTAQAYRQIAITAAAAGDVVAADSALRRSIDVKLDAASVIRIVLDIEDAALARTLLDRPGASPFSKQETAVLAALCGDEVAARKALDVADTDKLPMDVRAALVRADLRAGKTAAARQAADSIVADAKVELSKPRDNGDWDWLGRAGPLADALCAAGSAYAAAGATDASREALELASDAARHGRAVVKVEAPLKIARTYLAIGNARQAVLSLESAQGDASSIGDIDYAIGPAEQLAAAMACLGDESHLASWVDQLSDSRMRVSVCLGAARGLLQRARQPESHEGARKPG